MCNCEGKEGQGCACGHNVAAECKNMLNELKDTDFVGNRSYIVLFPEEFGIQPYCVQRFWNGNDGSVVMELIEPYTEGLTLPERLENVSKSSDIVICVKTLNPDNSEYYSEMYYVKDGSFVWRRQSVGYDIPGLRKYSVLFESEKHSIVKKTKCDDGAEIMVENFLKTI